MTSYISSSLFSILPFPPQKPYSKTPHLCENPGYELLPLKVELFGLPVNRSTIKNFLLKVYFAREKDLIILKEKKEDSLHENLKR